MLFLIPRTLMARLSHPLEHLPHLPPAQRACLSRHPTLEHPPGLFPWHSHLIVSIIALVTMFLYQLVNLLSYCCLSSCGSQGGGDMPIIGWVLECVVVV